MRKTLSILILLTLAFGLSGQTQKKLDDEIYDSYQVIDKELNNTYQLILKDYSSDTLFINRLRESQRNWLKFRDSEILMLFPNIDKNEYGTTYTMCKYQALIELTQSRIETLQKWTNGTIEGDVCSGSIKTKEINDDIIQINNSIWIKLLNNAILFKDFKTDELNAKIFSIDNLPGSAGFPNGEVTSDIFVAISEYGEIPEQRLFKIGTFYSPRIIDIYKQSDKIVALILWDGNMKPDDKIKYEITFEKIIKASR